jgi:predicted RND superfamily exporter protein
MKLSLAAVAAVLVCALSLVARSRVTRAAETEKIVEATTEEMLAFAAIDAHLRTKLHKLTKR